MSKFETKNTLFRYFRAGIWKQYYHIWNQYRRIYLIAKFRWKAKMPKLWTKHALLVIFHQKCLVWVFLSYNFLKNYFPYLKFGTTNACLGYCWAGISKGFWYFVAQIGKESCHIWNQYPWVCLIGKFRRKTKCPNHGSNKAYWLFFTNNVMLWYFSARISKMTIAIFEISTEIYSSVT